MSYEQFATELIKNVGGEENINNVIHCITRLRFYLNNPATADTEKIKKMNGVMSVIQAQGQYQVVVGNKVTEMYEAVTTQLNVRDDEEKPSEKKIANKTVFDTLKYGVNEVIGVITGTMIPIIGILAGSGIAKGLLAALVSFNLMSNTSQLYILINTIADGIFYFLPVILGYTAAQKMKVNPIVLTVVGGILIHPTIVGIASGESAYIELLGINFPVMNYVSSVFPIIVAAWVARYVERLLKKVIPSVISSIISPILEILVLSFLVILIVGPIITLISDGLAFSVSAMFAFNIVIGAAVYCALFPILVVFGMHWPLVVFAVNDIATNGASIIIAFTSVLFMGIAGASLAVAFKTKNTRLKQLGFASTISQLCGVSEPALYGILLKYKRVFYTATIANFVGGAFAGVFNLISYGFAGGAIGFASFINPTDGIDSNFYNYLITHLITFIIGFVLTWIFGYNDKMLLEDEK